MSTSDNGIDPADVTMLGKLPVVDYGIYVTAGPVDDDTFHALQMAWEGRRLRMLHLGSKLIFSAAQVVDLMGRGLVEQGDDGYQLVVSTGRMPLERCATGDGAQFTPQINSALASGQAVRPREGRHRAGESAMVLGSTASGAEVKIRFSATGLTAVFAGEHLIVAS